MTVHGECGQEGTKTAAPDSFSEHVGMYSIRTDFQMKGSASQSPFYFIVKMMDRDEVGSLCRPERRPEKKNMFYANGAGHRGIVLLKQNRADPKLLAQVKAHYCLKYHHML